FLGAAIRGQLHAFGIHVIGGEQIPACVDVDEGDSGAVGAVFGDLEVTAGNVGYANGENRRLHEQSPASDAGLAVGRVGCEGIPIANYDGAVGGIEMNAHGGLNTHSVIGADGEFVRGKRPKRRIL